MPQITVSPDGRLAACKMKISVDNFAEAVSAGEKVVVMPPRLEFTVGDQIRIRNEDSVEQSVGPYLVQAGQELLLKYGKEGTYEGYCPLTEGERYEIVVKAA